MQIDPLTTADAIEVVITTQDTYRHALERIAELEAALTHAVEIAENKRIGGTWDDLLPYRALLNPKK